MTQARVDAMVLAAGSSSRLGRPKQSVMLHGVSLLERAARLALECVDGDVHVILGSNAQDFLVQLENLPVCTHICGQWERGQNASLEFGLSQISGDRPVLIVLTDQYRLEPPDVVRLVEAWRAAPDQPAAASYAQTLGVPVVWPARYVKPLRAARRGQSLLDQVSCTIVPLAAAAYDLDTPQDLQSLREFERARAG